MKMAPTDKVARLYAGGDNLWKGYGFEFGLRSQLYQALKSLDDVKTWFRYMGKEFETNQYNYRCKKKHLMMHIDEKRQHFN